MSLTRYDYLALLLIGLVASLMLFIHFGQTPPPRPWSDESEIAADAVETLRDGPQLFYRGAGGSLAVWLEAGWMALFGKSLLGLRLLNALVNLLSALLLYLLVLEMPFAEPRRWLALTAALLLAASTWLLGLGRIAAPNWSLVPLMTNLAFYLLWRGLHRHRSGYIVAAAGVMGLLFYGYLPGAVLPLVPGLFMLLAWLRWQPRVSARFRDRTLTPWPTPTFGALLTLVGVTTLTAAPMLLFTLFNPTSALQRPMQLADTNELSAGAIFQDGLDFLSTFGLYPNWLWQGNFAGLAFDPLVTLLFVTGLLLTLWRWREPASLFLLIWWGVMMAPAFLSRSASTGFIFEVWRRGVGAQPASFIIIAVGLIAIIRWLATRWPTTSPSEMPRRPPAPAIITATLILLITIASARLSYRLYFEQWANSGLITTIFAQSPLDLVEWMAETDDADTLFLFPLRPTAGHTTRPELYTVRYLYEGESETAFPRLDETSIDPILAETLDGATRVKMMLPDRLTVDPKGYLAYALGSRGELVAEEQVIDYTVLTYQMRPDALSTETGLVDQNVDFGHQLHLTGQQIQPESPVAGQTVGVALRWRLTAPTTVDYNVRLTLRDARGFEWARADQPLLSHLDSLTTRHWSPNQTAMWYGTLPLPPDAPPGQYRLTLVVYEAESGQPLPPADDPANQEWSLSSLTIAPNPDPIEPATLPIPARLNVELPGSLRLLGVSNPPDTLRPGDQLPVTVWWQATAPPAQNIGVMLALAVPDGEPIFLFDAPAPLIADFPTTAWLPQQPYRARYHALLPATLTTNDYSVIVGLVDLEMMEPIVQQPLFPITVESRKHIYEAPPLSHTVGQDFGDAIRLLGFEFSGSEPPFQPGQEIQIKLQWQSLRETKVSYKNFLHLTDETGQILSQIDTLPQQDAAPTTGWVAGEIIEDTVTLTLPAADAPPPYRLIVGWYEAESGTRLKVDQQDHLVLFEAGKVIDPN